MDTTLHIVKEHKKERVTILEDKNFGFSFFRVNSNSYICIRMAGNVILDSKWENKLTAGQRSKLKDFLGGMYMAEVKREIKQGVFKICDLNSVLKL